jgi:hypothetical protein
MNTAPQTPAATRAASASFAAVLTLAMLLGIHTLATQADHRAEAQMAAASPSAPAASAPRHS